MDISDVFTKTFQLYTKTHFYHLKALGLDWRFHDETGEEWKELVEAVDTLGEQVVILDKKLDVGDTPSLKAKDAEDMCQELFDDNQELISILIETSKSAKDEGTKTLLADRLNVHNKVAMKLASIF